MELHTLRPSRGVDLSQLHAQFQESDWKACLPAALPDSLLLPLARDFRSVEVSSEASHGTIGEEASSLAAAIFVVMSVIARHPDRKSTSRGLEMSEEAVFRALKLYQIGIEREIVTRITGLASSYPESQLAADLLHCLK